MPTLILARHAKAEAPAPGLQDMDRALALIGRKASTKLGEVIAVRDMMYLSLSYDHRLVDGADAARFLSTVKRRLEAGEFAAELGL